MSTASPSLRTVLGLRLAGTALVTLLTLALLVGVVYVQQQERAGRVLLQEAQRHYVERTRHVDDVILREAELLRRQIEFAGVLDGPDEQLGHARLTAFLVSVGGPSPFTHVWLDDAQGRRVFEWSTRSRGGPLPTPTRATSWAYSEADRLLYRTVRSQVRLGARGLGALVLAAPIDNALLAANAYPETSISLHWNQLADVATSSPGPVPHAAPSERARRVDANIRWAGDDSPGAPELHVVRTYAPPVPPSELVAMVAAGGLGAFALAWLLIGRWARRHVAQIGALSATTARFTALRKADAPGDAALARAMTGASRELQQLGQDLTGLMHSVVEADAAQQAARQHLRELNASLEQRVLERTRELADARDRALASTRAKEQFLANMSHELRTPLAGLLGGLELVDPKPLPAEQQPLFALARRSGEALIAIINDVLDYSKLEAGKVGFARVPFRVSEMAAEAAALFAVSAAGKGITLTCETAPGSERLVLGDPLRLRQVLLNLLGNALKFTDHGHVRLRVQPQGAPPDDALRLAFSVEDSGVGIAPEVQAQLFQPFVQADQSAQRTGSGLGLAISQRLVRGMGGEITVDSVPGRGSTFRFALTFAPAPAAPSPPAPAVTGAGGPSLCGRVLLVEDNPVNRVIAVTMLRQLGLEVDECENGVEAVERLRATTPDLVLMDCQMPVLDGFGATARIRAGEAGPAVAGIPIVAITANALDGDAQRCLAAGMNAYLSKPFAQQQLAETLARWLVRRDARTEAGSP